MQGGHLLEGRLLRDAEDRPPPRCKECVSSDKGNNHVWWSLPGPSNTAARSLLHYQIDLLGNPAIDDVVVLSIVLGEVKNKNLPCTTEQDWGYGDGSPEDWVSSGGRSRNTGGCGGGGGHGGEKRSSMSA